MSISANLLKREIWDVVYGGNEWGVWLFVICTIRYTDSDYNEVRDALSFKVASQVLIRHQYRDKCSYLVDCLFRKIIYPFESSNFK